jgi:hypothetical protein
VLDDKKDRVDDKKMIGWTTSSTLSAGRLGEMKWNTLSHMEAEAVVGFAALQSPYAAGDNTSGKRVGGMPDVGATQRVVPTGYSK